MNNNENQGAKPAAAAQAKVYATVTKKQRLNTSTVAKVIGGISCRKAGGTQQDY